MRKDSCKRTSRVTRYYKISIVAICCLVLSVVMTAGGMMKFDDVVAHSSTPIGTSLTFVRSDAKVKVDDLYTDETNSVLIVRLTAEQSEFAKLPFKGSDYQVFISSPVYDGYQEASILFGKFSTDGDMFLIIPKPTTDIYSVVIMNTKFVAELDGTSSSSSSSTGDVQSLTQDQLQNGETGESIKKSLTGALSSYKYSDKRDEEGVITLKDDAYDWIGFRVTLDPAFKDNEAYRVKTLPGTMLSADGEFDFEGFFNKAFKEASTQSLTKQYDVLEAQKTQLKTRASEFEERLDANPSDTSAKNSLEETRSSISKIESDQMKLVEQLDLYEKIVYSPSYFQNLQTKAIVV